MPPDPKLILRNVADEIEIELVVERRVDRVESTAQEERVAVGGRAHDGLGADIAAAPRPIVDYELLAEPPREPWCDEPRENVGRSAGGRGGDDAHRPRRIVLRPSDTRHRRQRGSARCQMEKISTGKFHSSPSRGLRPDGD